METTTGAPAGATTETVSAERVAAETGSFSAFQDAAKGRREGKAPAPVTREKPAESAKPAVAGKDGQAAKGPSDKDREADERLTARIREAVDTSTAAHVRKIADLERELGTLKGRAAAGTPAADGGRKEEAPKRAALSGADIKKYEALPDAPKLDDKDAAGNFLYDTPSQHAVAMANFVRDKREEERAAEDRASATHVERVQREATRVKTFADRIEAFKGAHGDQLVDNGKGQKVALPLTKEVAGLHGYAKLAQLNAERKAAGQAEMPATVDHAIAEEIYDSEIPGHVAIYLSQHPEELGALRKATTPQQLSKAFGRLEERVIKADSTAAAVFTSAGTTAASATKPAASPDNKQTTAEAKREAQAAVDRSVSSAKPLNGNLGAAGAGGGGDLEEQAIKAGDFGTFAELQRQRREDELARRRGAR